MLEVSRKRRRLTVLFHKKKDIGENCPRAATTTTRSSSSRLAVFKVKMGLIRCDDEEEDEEKKEMTTAIAVIYASLCPMGAARQAMTTGWRMSLRHQTSIDATLFREKGKGKEGLSKRLVEE